MRKKIKSSKYELKNYDLEYVVPLILIVLALAGLIWLATWFGG